MRNIRRILKINRCEFLRIKIAGCHFKIEVWYSKLQQIRDVQNGMRKKPAEKKLTKIISIS